MTTLTKPSRADLIRQRRSSSKHSQTSSRSSGLKPGTSRRRPAETSYHPASILLPVEPRPVAPTTLRKLKSGVLNPHEPSRTTKSSAFGQTARITARGGVLSLPAQPKGSRSRTSTGMARSSHRNSYASVLSLGRTTVRAPLISLPNLGPRWISAGLSLLLGLMLYTMWTANTFRVSAADVTGAKRLDPADVTQMMGVAGQPIFKAVPSQIENNLRTAFPDLASVAVQVGFPNHILVSVVERIPVLVWSQDGNTTWVDANGISFTPRGSVDGLVPVTANSAPPRPEVDPTASPFDQAFIDPAMVQAILTLAPQVPAGAPMIYDPQYGMGWKDSNGCSVYFGQSTQDIPMKLGIYSAIQDSLTKQGIHPSLISVAYLDAPFYK